MKQVHVDMSQWDLETIIFALGQLQLEWEKQDRKEGTESPGVEHLKKLQRTLGMAKI